MTYRAQPLSRRDLREHALEFRKFFNLENELFFPVVRVLDILTVTLEEFNYEIVEDKELPSQCHAETDVDAKCIRIRQSVYDGAYKGNGRDRMTIAHEIGHYLLLVVHSLKLHREFGEESVKAFQDPEWQAKCFAGELMVPSHLVKDLTAQQVAQSCGVSQQAAQYQINKCK